MRGAGCPDAIRARRTPGRCRIAGADQACRLATDPGANRIVRVDLEGHGAPLPTAPLPAAPVPGDGDSVEPIVDRRVGSRTDATIGSKPRSRLGGERELLACPARLRIENQDGPFRRPRGRQI